MKTDVGSVDPKKEVMLVELTGACPHCDGPTTRQRFETDGGDRVETRTCDDCGEAWLTGWLDAPSATVEYAHLDSLYPEITDRFNWVGDDR